MNSLKELTYYKFRQMNPNQLFAQTKLQILSNKRAYLAQHLQQLENNVTIAAMDNLHLKDRAQQLKKQLNASQLRESVSSGSKIESYKRVERQKMKKMEQLNKLIDEYKHLCQLGIRYTNDSPSFNKQPSQDQKENSLNISQAEVKLSKKIKTKIYCNHCERQFLPQQYYRHCQDYHPDSSGYKSLRN